MVIRLLSLETLFIVKIKEVKTCLEASSVSTLRYSVCGPSDATLSIGNTEYSDGHELLHTLLQNYLFRQISISKIISQASHWWHMQPGQSCVLGFPQQCKWRIQRSAMWHGTVGWVVSAVSCCMQLTFLSTFIFASINVTTHNLCSLGYIRERNKTDHKKASTETMTIIQPYCKVQRASVIYILFPGSESRTSWSTHT
jgi:hypothetical protein